MTKTLASEHKMIPAVYCARRWTPRWIVLLLAVCGQISEVSATAVPAPLQSAMVRNLARGSALKILADLSGGLPMEVWKSSVVLEHIRAHQTKRKPASTFRILQELLEKRGIQGMWTGCSARVVEGFFSGAVLLASKETLRRSMLASPFVTKAFSPAVIGFVAGAGGGAAQALVMAPTSFLVTATTASEGGKQSVLSAAKQAWSREGIRGIYRGSSAVAARQATNWALRQGFTDLVRPKITIGGISGEITAGCLGAALSSINTPFEVVRIHSQSKMYIENIKQQQAEKSVSLFTTMRGIVEQDGVGGLYIGLVPRIAQACYQTVFLVCIPRLLDV